jgi:tetratricopeptide (TPR) repeat protein
MRRQVMMLAAMSLLICAAPYGRTEPGPDANNPGVVDKARMDETRGDLARIRSDYTAAVSYYSAALRVSRQDAALYNKLGIAELQLGDKGAAGKDFGKALKYNPDLTAALNNLGAVNLMQKKYRPAVGYLKRALAMDESAAATHLNLGEADRAMTEYARALELDADILSSAQDGVIAQIVTPQQRARVFYMIAKSYMKRGNPDGALDYLQRAKDLHYADLHKVYDDPDFSALLTDPRLAKIVKR